MAHEQLKEAALAEYLDECRDMAERFATNLARIESGEPVPELIAAVYRDMHTIKGSSHLFGFKRLGQLAHAMESCLDPVRRGEIALSSELVDVLNTGIDLIVQLLEGVREKKEEPDLTQELAAVLPRLLAILETAATGAAVAPQEKAVITESPTASLPQPAPETEMSAAPLADTGFGFFDDEPVKKPEATLSVVPDTALDTPKTPDQAVAIADTQRPPDDQFRTEHKSETIRVHVSLLDNLMNLIGELVLIRNQLLQYTRLNDDDQEFTKVSQRLNVLTAELQNEVMKTRMQPIGNVLSKFSRIVRDMGRELGKRIHLDIDGAETELDKTIIEAVQDPLMHVVRNAVDHGIEKPGERLAAGKPETGSVHIKIHHESGQVIIEVTDDGRGLDRKLIGAKAVERGLITADALSRMSDRDIHYLIMAPGFSTANAVTSLSGRGVGMDVVRTNVEKIGGMVDVVGSSGSGTTVRLKIPLTLAIVPALIVRSSQQRFAIPQAKLVELLRIDPEDAGGEQIESLQGKPVLRLRGKLLPLIRLNEILHEPRQARTAAQEVTNVVVLSNDGYQFGLIVDQIEDSADIVAKSLSKFLKGLDLFSGATILGDGSVALTLDVTGIASGAGFAEQKEDAGISITSTQRKISAHELDTAEYLIIDIGAPGTYAVPLSLVNRLEEFDRERIEYSGEQPVIRYRDTLLPLFSLSRYLNLTQKEHPPRDRCATIVVQRRSQLYGIEVGAIVDVVTLSAKIDEKISDRRGIMGTVVAKDRVIVVADIFSLIEDMQAHLTGGEHDLQSAAVAKTNAERGKHRILIAEDSSFLRNHIQQIVQDAGYRTDTAFDGANAFDILTTRPEGYYSLILSDIEMPNLDGLGLARKVREAAAYERTLLAALTTRFSEADIARGKQAGFHTYLEKLNPESLISALDSMLINQSQRKEPGHAAAS